MPHIQRTFLVILWVAAFGYTQILYNEPALKGTHPVKQEVDHVLLRGNVYQQALLKKGNHQLTKFKSKQFTVGDTTTFYVRNILNQDYWNKVTAKLVYDTSMVAFWIDTLSQSNLLNEEAEKQIVSRLKTRALFSTSHYSVDSSKGIMEIMDQYFGQPPDIDSDGKLDILLLNIIDDFENSGAYVAGFFDPNDMTDNKFSNKRDMLYIDLYPGILYQNKISIENAAATMAHEYQHLIHFNYEGEEWEYTFINEGLSEFTEIVCGFTPRSTESYFKNSDRSLLSWNYDDPIPDYSRASLWTHYLFEQIGYDKIKMLCLQRFRTF